MKDHARNHARARSSADMQKPSGTSLTTASGVNGYDLGDLLRRLEELRVRIDRLEKNDLPASSAIIMELFEAIYAVCDANPFTAVWILDATLEHDQTAARLLKAVNGAVGAKPTVQALSRFFRHSIGTIGPWRLTIRQLRSRDGRKFTLNRLS